MPFLVGEELARGPTRARSGSELVRVRGDPGSATVRGSRRPSGVRERAFIGAPLREVCGLVRRGGGGGPHTSGAIVLPPRTLAALEIVATGAVRASCASSVGPYHGAGQATGLASRYPKACPRRPACATY